MSDANLPDYLKGATLIGPVDSKNTDAPKDDLPDYLKGATLIGDAPSPDDAASGKHGGFWDAAKYGAYKAGMGFAHTAEQFDSTAGIGHKIEDVSSHLADPTYDPASAHFSALDPSTWSYAPRAAVEYGAQRLGGMAAGAAGGAIGGSAIPGIGTVGGGIVGGLLGGAAEGLLQDYGDNLNARMANQPNGSQASTGDKIAAGATALGEGALNGIMPMIPGKGALFRALPSLIRPIAGAGVSAAENAGVGVAGNLAQQVGDTAGTARGLTIDPTQALNAGALGAGVGAAIHGASRVPGAIDALGNAVKDSTANAKMGNVPGIDASTANDLSTRIASAGDTRTPQARYQTIKNVSSGLKQDINDIQNGGLQISPNSPVFDASAALDALPHFYRRAVNDGIKTVTSGDTLSPAQRGDISNALSGYDPSASALLSLLQQHDLLNNLQKLGKSDDKAGTFTSGFAASKAAALMNPVGSLRSMVGHGIGATVGGGALGSVIGGMAEHAVAPAFASGAGVGAAIGIPALAGLMALRKLSQGVSIARGNDNVLGQLQRFSDNQAQPGPSAGPAPQVNPTNAVPQAPAPPQPMQAAPMQAAPAPRFQPNGGALPNAAVMANAMRFLAQRQAQDAGMESYSPPALDDAISQAQPIAPQDTPSAQPKFNPAPAPDPASNGTEAPPINPLGIRARALAALAARRAAETGEDVSQQQQQQQPQQDQATPASDAPQQPLGDTHTYQGIEYKIPASINRAAYIRSLEAKQDLIDNHFQTALDRASSPKTQDALQDAWVDTKSTRNQDNARGLINKIVRDADPADRAAIRDVFNDGFYKIWRKKSASSK